jgi:hypothetical protein
MPCPVALDLDVRTHLSCRVPPLPAGWDATVSPGLKRRRAIEIPEAWDRVEDHIVCKVEVHVARTGEPVEATTRCAEPWASIATDAAMTWRWWPVRDAVGLGAVAVQRVDLYTGPDALELADTTRGSVFTYRVIRDLP